jgi:hypothetical protein
MGAPSQSPSSKKSPEIELVLDTANQLFDADGCPDCGGSCRRPDATEIPPFTGA